MEYPGANITGTDFSSIFIEIANKKIDDNQPNLCFFVADGELLSFEPNQFDFIISCETLEHVLHPQRMVNEMYRVLKSRGRFILTTENYFNCIILSWIKALLTRTRFDSGSGEQPNENFFLFFIVANFFKKSGLIIDKTMGNHFQWLLLPKTNPSKLCTKDFKSPFLKALFKPFGRHYCYLGHKQL